MVFFVAVILDVFTGTNTDLTPPSYRNNSCALPVMFDFYSLVVSLVLNERLHVYLVTLDLSRSNLSSRQKQPNWVIVIH